MTILSLISSAGHYGVESMIVALAGSLSSLRCRCIIAVFRDSRWPHTEIADQALKRGIEVEIVPCNGRLDMNAVGRIRKLLVKHRVDILHPHGYKADLYAYVAAWPHRVPVVATSHNWPSQRWSMRTYAVLDRLVLRRFDRVVAVSNPVRDTLLRWGGSREHVSLIPNGVDLELYRNAPPTLRQEMAQPADCLIGFVGRLVPDKGGALLLRAAQQVISKFRGTKFVFVGDGPARREWEALARDLGIQNHVIFTGHRNDMPGVYASLDMLVLPSLVESMPMCLLEAMATGKPVVATQVGGIPAVISSGDTGLLVEADNVDQLASAIIRLRENAEFARHLGDNAHLHICRHYSAEAMARKYIERYRDVIASRARLPRESQSETCPAAHTASPPRRSR